MKLKEIQTFSITDNNAKGEIFQSLQKQILDAIRKAGPEANKLDIVKKVCQDNNVDFGSYVKWAQQKQTTSSGEPQISEMSGTGVGSSFSGGNGMNFPAKKAFRGVRKKKNKYRLSSMLNEITYNQFHNEVKTRSGNQQLHKGIKEIQKRLSEVNRILEYTNKMHTDLNESGNITKYSKFTEQALGKIKTIMAEIHGNIKKLNVR